MSLRNRLAGHAARFRAALDDAQSVQARRLQAILARNAQCEYGRANGFARITDPAAYAQRVPVVRYDDLRSAIGRMADGEPCVLVADPVLAFEETGGSSGGAKLVPYTAAALAAFQRGLLPWLDDLYARVPALDAGRAYWSISPAARAPRRTTGGTPVGLGSDAAYLGEDVAMDVLASLCVPPQAALLQDIDAWRRYTLVHLLAAADLALVSIWSPTFLQELLRHAQQDAHALARCVADGRTGLEATRDGGELPAPPADPARAEHVRAILTAHDPDWTRLWPRLAVVSCWDQAAAAPCATALRSAFPGVYVQGKGLLATEGLVTIPFGAAPMPVLAVDSGFYEFVDARGVARLAGDVVPGEDYELLLTNDSGLYRYAIGDRVRVHAFVGGAPTLEFLGRTGVASDLCGEKLTEDFVGAALATLALQFAMLAAAEEGPRGYVLVLDVAEVDAANAARCAAQVEIALRANPQFAYARDLGQLAAVRAVRCAAPVARWLDLCRQRGQRLGDIKPATLCTVAGWQAHFPPTA